MSAVSLQFSFIFFSNLFDSPWKLFCFLKMSLFHSNLKALLTAKKNEIIIIIITINNNMDKSSLSMKVK